MLPSPIGRSLSLGTLGLFGTLLVSSCFVSNPNATAGGAGASDAAYADDGETNAGDAATAGPALCTKYGGYSTVETVIGDLFGALVADCRISRFFTTLTPSRQGHLHDCLVKQVAVLMACPGIKYDVDNDGSDCRDMATAHKGLSVRDADFDALVEDLVAVLQHDGVAQADIDALAPRLLALRTDIVTNSAPAHGKSVCEAGATP